MQRQKPSVKHSPPILDLNILPDEYRHHRLHLRTIFPWLLCLGLALLLVPAFRFYSAAKSNTQQAEKNLEIAQDAMHQPHSPAEKRDSLAAQIEEVGRQAADIETAVRSAAIQDTVWSEVLGSVVQASPAGVELTGVEQSDQEVVIAGLAEDPRLPLSYAEILRDSGWFSSVEIDSMERLEAPAIESEEVGGLSAPPHYRFEIALDLDHQEQSP